MHATPSLYTRPSAPVGTSPTVGLLGLSITAWEHLDSRNGLLLLLSKNMGSQELTVADSVSRRWSTSRRFLA
jgi:hypothetical protein